MKSYNPLEASPKVKEQEKQYEKSRRDNNDAADLYSKNPRHNLSEPVKTAKKQEEKKNAVRHG